MTTHALLKPETQVREVISRYAQAVRDKDIYLLQSLFAPDFVAFDLLPPLQYSKTQDYFKLWAECFAMIESPIEYQITELQVDADETVAFCRSLNHMGGNMIEGDTVKPGYIWFRSTVCLRKTEDRWLIVHEHSSFPTDMESGQACQDLKPE